MTTTKQPTIKITHTIDGNVQKPDRHNAAYDHLWSMYEDAHATGSSCSDAENIGKQLLRDERMACMTQWLLGYGDDETCHCTTCCGREHNEYAWWVAFYRYATATIIGIFVLRDLDVNNIKIHRDDSLNLVCIEYDMRSTAIEDVTVKHHAVTIEMIPA